MFLGRAVIQPAPMTENPEEFPPVGRAGIISIVGRTNVGKSTLVNHLLGEKVSIVTDTVQTTASNLFDSNGSLELTLRS